MRMRATIAAFGVATVLGATSAMGVVLNNGSTVQPYPNTWPGAALTVPIASLASPVIDDNGNFAALVVSTVHNLVPLGLNPLPNPGLTFTYIVSNVAEGSNPNEGLNAFALYLSSAACGAFDVNSVFVLGGANVPAGATLQSCVLLFLWNQSDQVLEGESSARLVVHTSATSYHQSTGAVIDGTAEDVQVLVPLVIPEPTTYASLFALGLAGFAAYRRFRV